MHTTLEHKSEPASGSPGCAAPSLERTKPSPCESWRDIPALLLPSHLGLSEVCVPWRSCRTPPRRARGIAARGAPSFSTSRVECRPVGRRRLAGCSAEWHPGTGCASRYVLLAGYVQRLLLGGCQNYLLNRKEKPYEKRWSRAVLGSF